jgi:hypothetical protein
LQHILLLLLQRLLLLLLLLLLEELLLLLLEELLLLVYIMLWGLQWRQHPQPQRALPRRAEPTQQLPQDHPARSRGGHCAAACHCLAATQLRLPGDCGRAAAGVA